MFRFSKRERERMIDNRLFNANWLCPESTFHPTVPHRDLPSTLKLLVLGLAVSLAAGCSTVSTREQAASPQALGLKGRAAAVSEEAGRDSRRFPGEGQTKSELMIPDHASIDAWTISYSEKKHQSVQKLLRRAEVYVLAVQKIFADQGLPPDLVYVALVESGFTPTARSKADAVGMWQFISSTGGRFGLEQNKYVDERRHPFKSAHAAAAYLSTLYDQFGSWSLALAAYNAGENGVQRALDQSGLHTFWELREHGYLPVETQDYVPKVFAAVRISRNPQKYGFYFNPRQEDPRQETVSVPGGLKLAWLGKKIGVEESTLKEHNPELCTPMTPPGTPCYELSVPTGTREIVLAALAEPRPSEEELNPSAPKETNTVRSTGSVPPDRKPGKSNPTRESKKTESVTPPAASKPDRRQPTQVPQVAKVTKKETSLKVAASIPEKKAPGRQEQKASKTYWYAVRQGDTLKSVADRFQISVDVLAGNNQISRNQKLTPGKVLTICTQEKTSLRPEKRGAN
jgi:membrane-bound lytic murein transglycosylase D